MKKRKTVILITSVTIIAAVSFLHSRGFKIYGYPQMYRSPPPADESWIKVQAMEREHFILNDGTKLPLFPFHLTEKGLSLTPTELAKLLFDLSPDDIYVRKVSGEWIVRDGNYYISSHPGFFPKREYGYFENELLDSISGAEINVPLDKSVIGFESEEALKKYFKTRAYQNSADNADKPRV